MGYANWTRRELNLSRLSDSDHDDMWRILGGFTHSAGACCGRTALIVEVESRSILAKGILLLGSSFRTGVQQNTQLCC